MAHSIIAGSASGSLLVSDEGLSFWGGVDAATGVVIDAHHPWCGRPLAGNIVMMPTSRGSCTGSGVLLELIQNGHAPAALIFREAEDVLTLGAMVAQQLFDLVVPVVRLSMDEYTNLSLLTSAEISESRIVADDLVLPLSPLGTSEVELSRSDLGMLQGDQGEAMKMAMEIIIAMAALQGASKLVSVTQVHIDGCIFASPANLQFAQTVARMGAKVKVPTTLNAISVDHENWRAQGVPTEFGLPASRLADAYVQMGAYPSFTCAPYLLDTTPKQGEVVAWAESNAVIYANSVLAARTVKHPDFFDLCIALTARAPLSGAYLDEHRAARRIIKVTLPKNHDDAIWPMLGYLAGQLAPDRIPLLTGLGHLTPSDDDLKAMCAAFGTTSAAPMLHLAGLTPEAGPEAWPEAGTEGGMVADDADTVEATPDDLSRVWRQLNPGSERIELIALGSPHFSLSECRAFAALMDGHHRAIDTSVIITLGRDTLALAKAEKIVDKLESAGVKIVPDICWCSISEPVFPPTAKTLMTNSGKYAHYAPGLSGRDVRFGSLADCANAARTGWAARALPAWLS